MKYQFLLLATLFIFFSCQEKAKQITETVPSRVKTFPKNISDVFDAHGGYDAWNKMNTLSYDIVKEDGSEKQLIDLQNRNELIEGENFIMGFDGTNTWVEADTSYKGNPVFYKNLMFYFYAMPFVIGDDGIIYETTKDLVVNGKSYPGIKISYKNGIGVSSKDEYFVHYDEDTKQMSWLGYTVTYFSKEKSQKISWIKYDDWNNFNGLKLPQSISWYKTENNLPTEFRNKVTFDKISISTVKTKAETFAQRPNAVIAE